MKHRSRSRKIVLPTVRPTLLFGIIAILFSSAFSPAVVKADPPSGNWQEVFKDDFEGTSLDPLKWSTCYWWAWGSGCTNGGAQEIQWFQPDEVLVENGILRLRVQKRSVKAYDAGRMQTFKYTSGMVSSHNKYAFQYGYVETRAKVPKGKGLWPTFWLSAEDRSWPPEINIVEFAGTNMQKFLMVLHYINAKGKPAYSALYWGNTDFSQDYHTYAVLWEPDKIIWYVDGVERRRYSIMANIRQVPMYVLATLAVGPVWANSPPDASTPFPSYFDIDYIKVWQRH